MPVRIRLATKGASRKRKISIERSPELMRGVECLLELAYVVIEKLEVVGDFFFPADGRRQDEHLATRIAGDGVRGFQIEVRLDHDDFDVLALHLLDQLDGVLRTRRNAGARLDVTHHVQMEVVRKVRPRPMISDDLAVVVGNPFGEPQLVFGIEPVVVISERVPVAFGARDLAGGDLENFGEARSVEVAGGPDLNFGIGGLVDERRQPADFKLKADNNEEVGALELEQKTGLGVDKVRILIAAGDGFHFNLVAADFLRERGKVGGGGHNLKLAGGARSERQNERAQQSESGENGV